MRSSFFYVILSINLIASLKKQSLIIPNQEKTISNIKTSIIFLDISIEDESKDVKLEGEEIETEELCSTELSLNQTIHNLESEVLFPL